MRLGNGRGGDERERERDRQTDRDRDRQTVIGYKKGIYVISSFGLATL